MKDLIKVDNLGLEENKAQEISNLFKPMIETMKELEQEFNETVKLEPNKENCKIAKTLRLKYVKIRTGTAEIHKKAKADILLVGRVMDGWKNTCTLAIGDKEEKLKSIEKHFENLEKERLEKLQETRALEVQKYGVEVKDNLGVMLDEVWEHYISGVKQAYEMRIEAESKAEEERLEKERIVKLEQDRRFKTSRLIEFIPDYDTIVFAELSEEDYMTMVNNAMKAREAYEKEQEAIRVENERLKKEAEEREAKERKERKEMEAKLEAERKEKERLLKEEEQRKEQEEKAEKERLKAEKKAESAPDKDKVVSYISNIRNLPKPECKSKEVRVILSDLDVSMNDLLNKALKELD